MQVTQTTLLSLDRSEDFLEEVGLDQHLVEIILIKS